VNVSETVVFTNTTTAYPPVSQWEWGFGDGVGSSDEVSPTYVYTQGGCTRRC